MDTAAGPVDWTIEGNSVSYAEAVQRMEARVEAIHRRTAPEQVWLLEHPPLYTAGTSAKDGDLISARFPVFQSGRGGQYTSPGPGQRVAYVSLSLNPPKPHAHAFVHALDERLNPS